MSIKLPPRFGLKQLLEVLEEGTLDITKRDVQMIMVGAASLGAEITVDQELKEAQQALKASLAKIAAGIQAVKKNLRDVVVANTKASNEVANQATMEVKTTREKSDVESKKISAQANTAIDKIKAEAITALEKNIQSIKDQDKKAVKAIEVFKAEIAAIEGEFAKLDKIANLLP